MNEVLPAQLAEWIERGPAPTIIDIRDDVAFRRGHLPEATNRPVSNPAELVNQVPDDDFVVLVCDDGELSRKAGEILRLCGLGRVAHLAGGMRGWNRLQVAEHGAEQRRFRRAAPRGFTLILKPASWLGTLHANLAVAWIDVSEEGMGVLVCRRVEVGDTLRARLANAGYRQAFDVAVVVRHVRDSRSRPGCFVIGCEFIQPSRMMRMCIRCVVDTGSLPRREMLSAYGGL